MTSTDDVFLSTRGWIQAASEIDKVFLALLEENPGVCFSVAPQPYSDTTFLLQNGGFSSSKLNHSLGLVLTHVHERVVRGLIILFFFIYQFLPNLMKISKKLKMSSDVQKSTLLVVSIIIFQCHFINKTSVV